MPPAHLSAQGPPLSIPTHLDTFQLHLTPFNSTQNLDVKVAGALVLITARYAPSRTSRDDDGFRSSLEGVESLLTPAYSAASRVAAAWRRGFFSRRFAAAGRREKNKNDAGSGRDGANAPRVNNSAVDVDAIPTREVALHCVDAVAAARLHGQLVAATTTTNGGGGGNALRRQ